MTLFDRKDTSICPHLADLMSVGVKAEPVDPPKQSRQSEIENRFNDLVRWGAKAQGAKRRRVAAPQCHQCSAPLSKPWSCLTCPFSGCMPLSSVSTSRRCMKSHWDAEAVCSFAVDPNSGAVFCRKCDDVVFSDHFERLHKLALARVEEAHDISREISIIGKGRERGEFKPWAAPSEGLALDTVKNPCRGLRPLLNLSQTCFLSAVLQALIHNPLLRAYFLSDKHNRHVCSNGSRSLGTGRPYLGPDGTVGPDRDKGCMCCELDRAFEEFHNEDKSPYGPITMLYSMWHASTELEGYGQQDAHSFFLAALDQIHAHAKGQLSSCNCIAHQTFAGSLLSSVTCSQCHTTSTTIDPILDVQLDFPTDASDMSALTLTDMLKRFCAAEKVGDATKGYDCSSCGGGAGVVAERKLAIKKLAPVLSFQLKRFAHNATSTKVESPVRFPSQLNMQPYVEPPVAGQKALPPSLFEYDLFAVVTHEGKLDNGHYWADVLSGDEWWHCDDDKVTPTTLKDVLSQRAYMLFYVKRSLAYAQPMSKTLGAVQSTAPSGTSTQSPAKASTSLPPILASPHAEKAPPIAGRTGHPITGMAV